MKKISSNNNLILSLVQAVTADNSTSVQKAWLQLLKTILDRYPTKPTKEDSAAQKDHVLINSIFHNLNDFLSEHAGSEIEDKKRHVSKNIQLLKHFENAELIELIMLGTSEYLAWNKSESYEQKDLLKAVADYEGNNKSDVFSHPPKKHIIKVVLTMKDFESKCVAITCLEREYAANTKEYAMTVTPSYGHKPELEGKKFKIIFKNCFLIKEEGEVIDSNFHSNEGWGFTAWGKDSKKEKMKLLTEMKLENKDGFELYSFSNIGMAQIVVLCEEVVLEEII